MGTRRTGNGDSPYRKRGLAVPETGTRRIENGDSPYRERRLAVSRTETRVGGRGLDVYPVVERDAPQAGRVALADGAELPLPRSPVQLAEHHRGLGGRVLGEVEAGELGVVVGVDDADVGVGDLAEALPTRVGVVDADREDDPLDVGRHRRQVHLDDLVVALALAGEVVAGVLDRAVRA